MKTKRLILIIFLFSIKSTIAQNYIPFPDSNAVWRENTSGSQGCNCCSDYQYTISGDTIINSSTYHKIFKSGVGYFDSYEGYCTAFINGYFNFYFGAYRNDVVNKRVYFIPHDLSTDTLLYDFNLSLGDTIGASFLNSASSFNFVSDIDTILIDSQYHKRYYISTPYNPNYVFLVEGLGSSYGLFSYLYPAFEMGTTLLCFIQNNTTVYPDSSYPCEIVTKRPEIINDGFFFHIIPNPFNDFAQIKMSSNFTAPLNLYVYNILGINLLKYKDVENGSMIGKGNLSSGVYFYRILSNDKIIQIGKIIIN